MNYESLILILQTICTELNISFMHGRDFDMNTFEGDFPLMFCYPIKFTNEQVSGEYYNVTYSPNLVLLVQNTDGIDRTAQTDLANIYVCDDLYSQFIEKIRQNEMFYSLQFSVDTVPLFNESAFCGTAYNINMQVSSKFKIVC